MDPHSLLTRIRIRYYVSTHLIPHRVSLGAKDDCNCAVGPRGAGVGTLRSASGASIVQWASRSVAAEHASRAGRRRRASFGVLRDPRARGERSIGPIMSVVYVGPTSHEWGKLVRSFHGPIKGVDKYGRRYSAGPRDLLLGASQGSSRGDQRDPDTLSVLSNRPRPASAVPAHRYRRAATIANPQPASMKSLAYYVDPTGRERLQGSEQDRTGRSDGEVRT
jgi:hypothetical protein